MRHVAPALVACTVSCRSCCFAAFRRRRSSAPKRSGAPTITKARTTPSKRWSRRNPKNAELSRALGRTFLRALQSRRSAEALPGSAGDRSEKRECAARRWRRSWPTSYDAKANEFADKGARIRSEALPGARTDGRIALEDDNPKKARSRGRCRAGDSIRCAGSHRHQGLDRSAGRQGIALGREDRQSRQGL